MSVAKEPVKGDPFQGFLFAVEINGITNAYFTEVSGIGSETEVIEHKVMGPKGAQETRKVPGRLKWGDVTFKRGLTSNLDFWTWFKNIQDGKIDGNRRPVTISMYDQATTLVAKWEIDAAWVSKISGPSIKSDSGEVGIEEMTLVCEGQARVKV